MKIIFLDIDGVLNCDSSKGFYIIDEDKLLRLKYIIDTANAEIVLISSWKYSWSPNRNKCRVPGGYLYDIFSAHGIYIAGKTVGIDIDYVFAEERTKFKDRHICGRGEGILQYLSVHKADAFVIIDDNRHDYNECGLTDYWVRTVHETGINDNDVQKATCILNKNGGNQFNS